MRLHPTFAAAGAAALLAACASGPGGSGPSPNGPSGLGGPSGPRGPFNAPSFNTNAPLARAELHDLDGRSVGTATFTQAPYGVLVSAQLTGLPAGVHAMHIHEVGRCEPPFTSAGGHFNPAFRQHGVKNRGGYHAGDLPNFTAPASGTVRVDAITRDVILGPGANSLFSSQGTALMIHSDPDDYASDPGGNAGTRIACGVIVRDSTARTANPAPRR
ncbi:hypothetical protein tb265_33770 [Gemmatimonadetes bacterium T265]|nr:hypothetical protein tb265_33770 [Gemmatimonadetes bacterium T265]